MWNFEGESCALVVIKRHKSSIKLYILQGFIVIGNATVYTYSMKDEKVTKL